MICSDTRINQDKYYNSDDLLYPKDMINNLQLLFYKIVLVIINFMVMIDF
jgi:hypothetical protein